MTEKNATPPMRMTAALSLTAAFSSGVISDELFRPLMRRNQMMLVTAMPEKTPIFTDDDSLPPISPEASVVTPLTR